jgi:hypothetical protein
MSYNENWYTRENFINTYPIANEIVPDKYKGKFIINSYRTSRHIDNITIFVKYFDGETDWLPVSPTLMVKIKRKLKLLSILNYND